MIMTRFTLFPIVIPAQAGIHGRRHLAASNAPFPWIPAFAGMTKEEAG
jgi:hypothetical protein